MRIFNVMLSRELGGIQQAYLDYGEALQRVGAQVWNIAGKGAAINCVRQPDVKLPNWTPWCWVSRFYLNRLMWRHRPDLIIAHGGRAIYASRAAKPKWGKVVGVTHTPNPKSLIKADYLLAITRHLREEMIALGYDGDRIFFTPNMTSLQQPYKQSALPKGKSWVVGSYGRLCEQKGYRYLLEAMAALRAQGVQVKLKLGGAGELEADLKAHVNALNLEDHVEFLGWIEDRSAFFENVDVFCLPSIAETFGLVLLEAMAHSTPIVATRVSGPLEVLEHETDGLLVEPGSGTALAEGLRQIMENHDQATVFAKKAHQKLQSTYAMDQAAPRLLKTLKTIAQS